LNTRSFPGSAARLAIQSNSPIGSPWIRGSFWWFLEKLMPSYGWSRDHRALFRPDHHGLIAKVKQWASLRLARLCVKIDIYSNEFGVWRFKQYRHRRWLPHFPSSKLNHVETYRWQNAGWISWETLDFSQTDSRNGSKIKYLAQKWRRRSCGTVGQPSFQKLIPDVLALFPQSVLCGL
jgi:hypothetical protein